MNNRVMLTPVQMEAARLAGVSPIEYARAIAMQGMQNTGGLGGQHWNTASQIYGNPLGQSGLGAIGAQNISNAQAFQSQLAALAGTYTSNNTGIASNIAQQFAQQAATYPGAITKVPAVKHEGIRAGEIIGYRCWRLINGWLVALTQQIVWAPGEPMQGDLSQYGVYAFNLMGRAIGEMTTAYNQPVITGGVQMWGEIIEHEFGYRSEFAKIVSLDYIQGADESVLQALRVKYGVDSR